MRLEWTGFSDQRFNYDFMYKIGYLRYAEF